MAGYRRRRRPIVLRCPEAPPCARPVPLPSLSTKQRECLAVACAGGGVASADDRLVLELHELGPVQLARQSDECRFVASAEGRRVAALLVSAPQAA